MMKVNFVRGEHGKGIKKDEREEIIRVSLPGIIQERKDER